MRELKKVVEKKRESEGYGVMERDGRGGGGGGGWGMMTVG